MAEAGNVTVVISADTRPFTSEMLDARDKIDAIAASTSRARYAAVERMHQRHLSGAADVFDALAARRRWWNPGRYIARRHARACRRLVAMSVKAGERKK